MLGIQSLLLSLYDAGNQLATYGRATFQKSEGLIYTSLRTPETSRILDVFKLKIRQDT